MKTLNRIWRMMGGIHLTFYLISMIMADLTAGFFSLKFNNQLFHPLNDMGFVKWADTWAKHNPYETAWLFILIGLMALLSVNTFICTMQRVITFFQQYSATEHKTRFVLRLSPHIMHYALLIMLLGYLVSYLTSQTYLSNILLPGKSAKIPGSPCVVRLTDLKIDYYQGQRLSYMQGRGLDVKAELCIQCGKESMTRVLRFNRPVRFHSYSLHLKDFSPKSKSDMATREYIKFTIKKDPGLGFYFSGMILFAVGLLLYLLNWVLAVRQ
ncbi:MAG: hypothetical protein SWO11_07675 [Thermodesulfobacteriota bacterium]|nr:hypothetical protein [Thermodesulfobacteriota bacterium]